MRVEKKFLNRMTLAEFADANSLILEIRERRPEFSDRDRFYAYFKGVEVKDGSLLCSSYGNGRTPMQAAENYILEISGKLLVVNAMSENRREIYAPILAGVGQSI